MAPVKNSLQGVDCPVCGRGKYQLESSPCEYVVDGVKVRLARYICTDPYCGHDEFVEEGLDD